VRWPTGYLIDSKRPQSESLNIRLGLFIFAAAHSLDDSAADAGAGAEGDDVGAAG